MRSHPYSFVLVALASVLILAGCDVAGNTTGGVILSENSPIPPTVEYTFEYQTNGSNNQIDVLSDQTDDLESVLADNGYSRRDVVSARIDSVSLERLSPVRASKNPVFEYLSGTTVNLGSDGSGTRIAEDAFDTTQRSIRLPVVAGDVTDVVRNGSTRAFLQLDTNSDAPDGRQDRVEVTVYFRIEVE